MSPCINLIILKNKNKIIETCKIFVNDYLAFLKILIPHKSPISKASWTIAFLIGVYCEVKGNWVGEEVGKRKVGKFTEFNANNW